jgi:hypothetical protein
MSGFLQAMVQSATSEANARLDRAQGANACPSPPYGSTVRSEAPPTQRAMKRLLIDKAYAALPVSSFQDGSSSLMQHGTCTRFRRCSTTPAGCAWTSAGAQRPGRLVNSTSTSSGADSSPLGSPPGARFRRARRPVSRCLRRETWRGRASLRGPPPGRWGCRPVPALGRPPSRRRLLCRQRTGLSGRCLIALHLPGGLGRLLLQLCSASGICCTRPPTLSSGRPCCPSRAR